MRRGPIYKWQPKPSFLLSPWEKRIYPVLAPVSRSYPSLIGRLPTCYSPVRRWLQRSKLLICPLDLHVLGTPPAFVLSQDQTLQKVFDLLIKIKVLFRSMSKRLLELTLTFLFCLVFKDQFIVKRQLLYFNTQAIRCQQLFYFYFFVFVISKTTWLLYHLYSI